ncbi:hypothetical protein [Oleisolibacter albus]|uniref:hypothetical protein n=1 Tax=Oleisolibacter albus TaxID=2171757 RepID=UPI000DF156EE|nr:hypothetical protein [Oleisolibacter albus]
MDMSSVTPAPLAYAASVRPADIVVDTLDARLSRLEMAADCLRADILLGALVNPDGLKTCIDMQSFGHEAVGLFKEVVQQTKAAASRSEAEIDAQLRRIETAYEAVHAALKIVAGLVLDDRDVAGHS